MPDSATVHYEMAITLASGDDPVGRAIAVMDQLGAVPAAAYARRRLRDLGITSVPRGIQRTADRTPDVHAFVTPSGTQNA